MARKHKINRAYPNRSHKGSGPQGRRSHDRLTQWVMNGRPRHGRGSGVAFEDRPHVASHEANCGARQAKAQRLTAEGGTCTLGPGKTPHPTKRGPGRYA